MDQVVFQPLHGCQVQVVCGLVQQKEVWRDEQETSQSGARALASAEDGDRLVVLAFLKAQAGENAVNAQFVGVAARLVKGVGAGGVLRHDGFQVVAAGRHALFQGAQGGLLGSQGLKGLQHGVVEGGVAGQRGLLGKVAEAQAASGHHLAGVGLVQSGRDIEQRGLARAVGADQGDLLAGVHLQGDVAENLVHAERLAQFVGR